MKVTVNVHSEQTVIDRLRQIAPTPRDRAPVTRAEYVRRMMLAAGVSVYVPEDEDRA